jgi:hypothetical protein
MGIKMRASEEKVKKIKNEAIWLMDTGVEPTSAIKAAANNNGIPFGDEMGDVVTRVRVMLEQVDGVNQKGG